jgi:hypothetical protein
MATTLTGSCLCGAVAFAVDGEPTAIEFCHCNRCRKAYGSAFAATLYALAAAFRWLRGAAEVVVYAAPLRDSPPPYRHAFCRHCGAPLPIEMRDLGVVELPTGALDDDPGSRPLRHIFTTQRAPWFTLTDALPQYDRHVPRAEHLVAALLARRRSDT